MLMGFLSLRRRLNNRLPILSFELFYPQPYSHNSILKMWGNCQVAAYIEDMQDVKSPKDVLKSVHAAVDEAVEVLRDDKALLDVRFLGPIMDRS